MPWNSGASSGHFQIFFVIINGRGKCSVDSICIVKLASIAQGIAGQGGAEGACAPPFIAVCG